MGKIIDRVRHQKAKAYFNECDRIAEETRDVRRELENKVRQEMRDLIVEAFRVDEERFAPPPTPWWKISWW